MLGTFVTHVSDANISNEGDNEQLGRSGSDRSVLKKASALNDVALHKKNIKKKHRNTKTPAMEVGQRALTHLPCKKDSFRSFRSKIKKKTHCVNF